MKNLTYKKVLEKIKKIKNFGSKPGLERIEKLLRLIENPQDNLKFIHVAGTNGKGSVSFLTCSILKEAGYKVGLYTSPEIFDFRERITINGKMIPKNKVCEIMAFFEPILAAPEFKNDPITEFELTTAMAFKYFFDEKCDIVVLETGLGGKMDATNVIKKPLCSVITSVSLDHTHILGNTLEKIAKEKLGIVKKECPLVLGKGIPESIQKTAEKIARLNHSKLYLAKNTELKNIKLSVPSGISFEYENTKIKTPLLGLHQTKNFATVLNIISVLEEKLKITKKAVCKGFKNVKIPCRLEVISENPLFILDGAHNEESVRALTDFIKNYLYKKYYLIGIIGMYKDKDYKTTISLSTPFFDEILTVKPNSQRALSLEKITNYSIKLNKNTAACEKISEAVSQALKKAKNQKNSAIIAFGSFSIMSDIKHV